MRVSQELFIQLCERQNWPPVYGITLCYWLPTGKGKVLPQQAEVAQGLPGRLRLQIFLTFGPTRVVGCQPYAPTTFTPGEIPGTHF